MSGKYRTGSSSSSKTAGSKALLKERLKKAQSPPARVHVAVGYASTCVKASRRRAEFKAGRSRRKRSSSGASVHDEEPFAEASRRLSSLADRLYRRAAEVAGSEAAAVRRAHELRRGRLKTTAGTGSITQRVGQVSAYLWSAFNLAATYGVTADLEPLVTEFVELGDQYLSDKEEA